MEEAAKAKIPVVVLIGPIPLAACLSDGPMLEEKWRSFVGYLNALLPRLDNRRAGPLF